MRSSILAALAAVASALLPAPGSSQRPPDFSGTWMLVEATTTSTRGSTAEPGKGAVRTTVNTVSGAAFNCGRECVITHKGQTLEVDNALLATDYAGYDPSHKTPGVTLRLDGRERQLVDSFSPNRQIPVTARWVGNALQIDTRSATLTTSQVLSLAGEQLVIVSVTHLNGERRTEVTFRYARK